MGLHTRLQRHDVDRNSLLPCYCPGPPSEILPLVQAVPTPRAEKEQVTDSGMAQRWETGSYDTTQAALNLLSSPGWPQTWSLTEH